MSTLTTIEPSAAAPVARATRARRLAPSLGAAAALALLALLYFALTGADGIITTNDGSHYALTKALAADGTVRIDRYVAYGAIRPRGGTPTPDDYRDVSLYDGHFYSDRPPGTAFLAVPFYWAGEVLARVAGRPYLDLALRAVTVLPPLLGAATILALYWLARGLGAGNGAALATAATGALTTLLLKYATLLYSHIAGAACVTAALATLLLAERRPGRRWPPALAGLLLGYGGVAEYPNLPLVAPFALYLAWQAWRGRAGWGVLASFLLGWLPPVALLAGYQWLAFGRPWRTSYTFQFYFDWSRSPLTTYVTPPQVGLRWLLLGPSGLFVVTPALLLALWGLAILARRAPARAALLVGVALVVLLPTSAHRTYYGGGEPGHALSAGDRPGPLRAAGPLVRGSRAAAPPGGAGLPAGGGGDLRGLGAGAVVPQPAGDVRASGGGIYPGPGLATPLEGGELARSGGGRAGPAAPAVRCRADLTADRTGLVRVGLARDARGFGIVNFRCCRNGKKVGARPFLLCNFHDRRPFRVVKRGLMPYSLAQE